MSLVVRDALERYTGPEIAQLARQLGTTVRDVYFMLRQHGMRGSPDSLATPQQRGDGSKRKRPAFEQAVSNTRRRLDFVEVAVDPEGNQTIQALPSNMPRRSSRGYGAVLQVKSGRGLRRPKNKYNVAKGVSMKYELNDAGTSSPTPNSSSSILFHTSHPAKYTLKMIVMSVLDLWQRSTGRHVRLWSENLVTPYTGVLTAGNKFVVWYRQTDQTGGAHTSMVVTPSGTDTYESFAIRVCDKMIDTFYNKTQYEITWVAMIEDNTVSTQGIMSSRHWKADDLMISVKGESRLQIQNRTPASESVVEDTQLLAGHIGANPIRGKMYSFNGSDIHFSDMLGSGSAQGTRIYPGDEGYDRSVYNNLKGAVPAASLQTYLTKPPPANFFKYCTGSKYVGFAPGEIRCSKINHVVTKSFDGWMKAFQETFAGTTGTDAATRVLGSLNNKIRAPWSRSNLLILEKKCDAGGSAAVTTACEMVNHYRSHARVKKGTGAVTMNSDTIAV